MRWLTIATGVAEVAVVAAVAVVAVVAMDDEDVVQYWRWGGGIQWRTQLLRAMAMGATATKMAIDSV